MKQRFVKLKKWIVCIPAFLLLLAVSENVQAQTVKQIQVTFAPGASVGKTIQDALNEALEDQSGNTLYEITLPAGTYQLDTLLKVFSYTTIKMEGCTLVRDTDKTMLRIGYEDTTCYGYSGQHDITIVGGCFDGGGMAKKVTGSIVRMGHASNITIRNVTFQNVYETHHVELAGCENVLFEGCTFKDFFSKKDKTNSANNEALQFDVLHNAEHFPKYPAFDDTPCRNVTVSKCRFDNLQRGLGTHSAVAGSYFTNMQFVNNEFTNINGYAIIATNYQDSVIQGNQISDCGAGILFRSMVQGYENFYTPLNKKVSIRRNANSLISDNQITVKDFKYKNVPYGISLYGEKLTSKKKDVPKGDYTLEGVTVKNNTVTMNNRGYGIWLQGADKCKLDGNSVTMDIKSSVSGKGNGDCIRLVKSKNNQITGNTLTQKQKNKKTNKACGIVVTTKSGATISGNQIHNSPKDAIFVVDKSKATVKGNNINKAGRYGLNVCENSTVTSKKNKLKGCKKKQTNTYKGGKIK